MSETDDQDVDDPIEDQNWNDYGDMPKWFIPSIVIGLLFAGWLAFS